MLGPHKMHANAPIEQNFKNLWCRMLWEI